MPHLVKEVPHCLHWWTTVFCCTFHYSRGNGTSPPTLLSLLLDWYSHCMRLSVNKLEVVFLRSIFKTSVDAGHLGASLSGRIPHGWVLVGTH